MIKDQHFSQLSLEQSQYDKDQERTIKDQEIRLLLKTKTKFSQFILNPLNYQSVSFGPANTTKYSKQIKQGSFDGKAISQLINKRVDKMIKNQKIKKNWCKDDCTILAWILDKLTKGRHLKCPEKLKQIYWEQVANLIPGTTPEQCKFKWLSMKTSRLAHNKWNEQQSKMLQRIVKDHGHQDWKKVSRLLYEKITSNQKKYRTPKQCRQQWNCYLNPSLKKGSWSFEQDLKLLNLVDKNGKHWSLFKKNGMNSRTQNAIKNRYKFIISKMKLRYPEQSEQFLLKYYSEQILSAMHDRKQKIQIEGKEQDNQLSLRTQFRNKEIQIMTPSKQLQSQSNFFDKNLRIVEFNIQEFMRKILDNHQMIPAIYNQNGITPFIV